MKNCEMNSDQDYFEVSFPGLEPVGTSEPNQINLLNRFSQSLDTKRILDLMVNFPYQRGGFSEFIRSFAGRVFEEVAFTYLQEHYPSPRYTVLSPSQMSSLYRWLYGDQIQELNGLNTSLYGRTIPDNLVFRRSSNHIVLHAVCECKTSLNSSKIQDQYHALSVAHSINENLGLIESKEGQTMGHKLLGVKLNQISPDLPPLPVATADHHILNYVTMNNTRLTLEGVKQTKLPFSSYEFNDFLNLLVDTIRINRNGSAVI